ncbi:hypothetical protein BDW22DRAFT_1360274 [Trametopsis cervina]|nr:hypothetical protein BDW22DRAFT_1360274 [Trametopsis cervina]
MPVAGPSDPWDDSSTAPRISAPVKRDEPIRDDWDDDDEDDEDEDPHKVWSDANAKAPMPQLVIAPSATSSSAVSPPPAAFQPSIRILKRPSASSASNLSAPPADASQKSLADREANYQAARQRIFGTASASSPVVSDEQATLSASRTGSSASHPTATPTAAASTKIIRNPRGPDTVADSSTVGNANGFRKTRKPQVVRPPN